MMPLKKNKFGLNIRLKIFAVIVITIVLAFIAYFIYKAIIIKHAAVYDLSQQEERKSLLQALIVFKTEILEKTSIDYSCFDWMVQFANNPNPNPEEAKEYITASELLKIDLFQVYNLKMKSLYLNLSNHHVNKGLQIDLPKDFFDRLYIQRTLSFYTCTPNGLAHIYASTIHHSHDTAKQGKPNGYLILAEIYDTILVEKLEKTINNKIIINLHDTAQNTAGNSDINLFSYNNQKIGTFSLSNNSYYRNILKSLNKNLEWIFIAFVIILCGLTILTYEIIVLKPLQIIHKSLNTQSEPIARTLMYRHDEFGKISRMIIRFYQHRKLLNEKLEKLNETQKALKELNTELSVNSEYLLVANSEIKNQQKATTDNIYYASAVQRAALIPSFEIEKVFSEHFILFKPRDIVSGDFYWFYEHHNKYYVATADCTGHGLSGSLMSMLGISFLNQIIHLSDKNTTAAEILTKLRNFIVNSLHQQGSSIEVYDGMDIGLCIFDFSNMKLEYAAAYNPLYLVRHNKKTKVPELILFKGDSMPAGIYEKQGNFSNYTVSLQKNDTFYLFTDGLVDQFGGPNDKKFLTKNLKELILSVANENLAIQKEKILSSFEEWKGKNFQVDDVTMIGLRI
jgi:serine phosphatase RsbU (regulator of sigma subunit)